ncbi:TetR/AcrR family transcriptional regulator [Paenibacillus validus]|uniref:TetR family transcriptional regulator n=1 Tax=Paenibacillus validus TaxID=44253 RepID=A0A7X2Z9L3_9BACL|nr:TetR/AcrR family transcriptional regulator [Paenibacillus validus]MED4601049.1 TetR/AcrR family transcriptional regulator [Paenibacillus validus]MED4607480.1 TetR/AcrR family transcriptional regulator [Paenibacillus validus]MUG70265.1 TetR family transcriptional regulator [Paenibacillus validus]
MERNRTKKGELSRIRLLEAATQQFALNGYFTTKISDIVKAAGLTQAAFYLYFPSKDAIFSELVNEYRMRLKVLANAGSLVTPLPSSDVPEQVKENLKNLFLFLNASPELTKIALYDSPDSEQIKKEMMDMIIHNLRSNQEAGHVRKDLPIEVAAECMVAMLERMVTKIVNEETNPVSLANDITDVILYGILSHRKDDDHAKDCM